MAAQKKQLSLDTNFVFDLAGDKDFAHELRKIFQSKDYALVLPPTALVVTRATQLLTCYSWLASRGIKVPADASLVCLANDSWYADLHLQVCHYLPNSQTMSRQIAKHVLELVATGQVVRDSIRVPMEYGPEPRSAPRPTRAPLSTFPSRPAFRSCRPPRFCFPTSGPDESARERDKRFFSCKLKFEV